MAGKYNLCDICGCRVYGAGNICDYCADIMAFEDAGGDKNDGSFI